MNQNPIIKALQDELAKECLDTSLQHGIKKADKLRSPTHTEYQKIRDAAKNSHSTGHEAATARLLGLLEKSLKVIEFYGNQDNWQWYVTCQESENLHIIKEDCEEYVSIERDLDGEEYQKIHGSFGGKKAREFLTTIADASGEISKPECKHESQIVNYTHGHPQIPLSSKCLQCGNDLEPNWQIKKEPGDAK